MLRKQTRRSFTVETKGGANQGRAIIIAKAPRVPRKGARNASTVLSSVFLEPGAAALDDMAKDAAPRRILPSLVTWEPSEPEPASTLAP